MAKDIRENDEKNGTEECSLQITDEDLEEILNPNSKTNILNNYLLSFDLEKVKDIMAVMYLGKDYYYSEEFSPHDFYKLQRKHIEDDSEWNDKEIVVYQITSKSPLDKFLERGIRLLK